MLQKIKPLRLAHQFKQAYYLSKHNFCFCKFAETHLNFIIRKGLNMKKITPILGIIFLFAVSIFAQSQASTGNIEGRVLDQNGAVVPNVSVSATNQDTGFGKTVMTDNEGNYIFVLLPPGKYKVTAKAASGFQPADYTNVPVSVGGKTALDITLSVSGGVTTVDVEADRELVETTRSSVSSTVNEKAISTLPVNGRNFLDFATLTPGVTRDPTRGGDLAVGGQKGTFNSLQVDGADNNNTFFGQSFGRTGTRPPYQFSIETVKEFQINQNGFSAEFGRAAGAVINVVTKSGTNKLSGGAFLFFRDEALNSNTPILTARNAKRPKSQIKQFGGRIGGPFVKDRAFYFFAYDGQRANIPQVIDAPGLAAALVASPTLNTSLLPKLNTYDVGRQQDVYLFKTDVIINEKNSLSVRFNQQNFTGANNENSGALSAEEHSGNSKANTTTLAGTLTSSLTNTIFNEFRMQYGRDKEPGEANSTQPEARIQTGQGFLNIGRNNFSPRETTIKRFQVIDNVTFLVGQHNIKTGVDLNFDQIFNFFPGLFTGQYTFNSYALFASNTPASFTQNFAGTGTTGATTEPNNNEFAFFVQDDWRVRPNFTLNLGLRYDYQEIAAPQIQNPNAALLAAGFDTSFQPKDKNNFAPRLGISYAVDQKTVIRGGYGVFYARTPAILTGTAHSQNGIQVTGVNLTCTTLPGNPCLVYPNIFSTVPTVGTPVVPSLFFFSKDYKQSFVHQGRVAVERELVSNLSLAVSYMVFKGDSLTQTRDLNLGAPVSTTVGSFTFLQHPTARPNTAFTRIQLFDSTARSLYHGLGIELKKRFAKRYQFTMAYTFSKAKDNKPDQTAVVVGADDIKYLQNQLDPESDYGRSDLDIKHRFVANASYDLGKFTMSENQVLKAIFSDWTLSGILTLQSGFAYSATVSGDLRRDGNSANDRVPGTERNQFTTPSIYTLDMRLGRVIPFTERYKMTILAEGFNIFNRSNIASVNTAQFTTALTTPTANFGLVRTFLGERQFQLGVKFDF